MPDYLAPLANHLWQSSLFAAAVWLSTLALKQNSAAVRHRLWVAASVKFLIPFSIFSAIGSHFLWVTVGTTTPTSVSAVVERISLPFGDSIAAVPLPAEMAITEPNHLPPLLLSVWICGFVLSAVWWFLRWQRLRRTAQQATPLNLIFPIPLLRCREPFEPGVFGILDRSSCCRQALQIASPRRSSNRSWFMRCATSCAATT
jgi:hypothetical protein